MFVVTLAELKKSGMLVECEQNTEEWLEARRGKVTSSMFKAATAEGRKKGSPSKTRFKYMCELISERATGNLVERHKTRAMDWGHEWEDSARSMYELETGLTVVEVGFIKLDENIGCSPDGLVGDDGTVQIKCPESHNHIATILEDRIPPEYVKQVQGELWITGRQWCDFVSYDPRNPDNDLFIKRVPRDEEKIKEIASGVQLFVDDLLRHIEFLRGEK